MHFYIMLTLTLVSTSVHSLTLLSGELSLLRLLSLDMGTSFLTPDATPARLLDREAIRVDRRIFFSRVAGVLGRECLSTSTSVN